MTHNAGRGEANPLSEPVKSSFVFGAQACQKGGSGTTSEKSR